MKNEQRLKRAINTYGNTIVEITLSFIKHRITKQERDILYKAAGHSLIKKINRLPVMLM